MSGAIGDIEQQRLLDIQNTVYGGSSDGITQLLQLQGYLDTINSDIVDSSSAITSLSYQNETKQILDHEMGRLIEKKNGIDDAYAGTKRIVQLNQNYQKRYWDYTKVLIMWVFILFAYLLYGMLETYFPMIPPVLFDILMIIFVTMGILYTLYIYGTLQRYDLANYGKIDVGRPSSIPTPDPTATPSPGSANGNGGSNYLQSNFDGQAYCGTGTKWSALGGYCRPDATKGWNVKNKVNITSANCENNKVKTTESNSAVGDVCEPFGPVESTDYGFVQ